MKEQDLLDAIYTLKGNLMEYKDTLEIVRNTKSEIVSQRAKLHIYESKLSKLKEKLGPVYTLLVQQTMEASDK